MKRSMAILALFALIACNNKGTDSETDTDSDTDTTSTTHDVVVVGAGSAGLYAAKTLIADGYDVLIIEATDRIGGHVKSETLGDIRVELGAEEHYTSTGSNPVWPAIRSEYGQSIYVEGYQGLDAYSMDGGTNTCWTTSSALHSCDEDSDVTDVDVFWSWYWRPNRHTDADSTLADDVLDEYGIDSSHRAYHLYDAGFVGASYATNLDKLGARSLALQDNEWDLSGSIRVLGDKDLGYADALETVWWDDVVANCDLLLGMARGVWRFVGRGLGALRDVDPVRPGRDQSPVSVPDSRLRVALALMFSPQHTVSVVSNSRSAQSRVSLSPPTVTVTVHSAA